MKRLFVAAVGVIALAGLTFAAGPKTAAAPGPEWSMNATVIEACSCTMFCQCYFVPSPSGHHDGHEMKHFCKANNAYKVNHGHYGAVKLDGAKFWFAGDAGEDFALPKLDWAVLIFDSSVTKDQSDALLVILRNLRFYRPERWNSYEIGKPSSMNWSISSDRAEASLGGGKTAEVVLSRLKGMNDGPVTLNNLKYFGYPRNDGFLLMPNEVEAYRVGEKAFEFRGSNGFLTTVEITSKDIKK